MEQGTPSEKKGQATNLQQIRLATRREVGLLSNYINAKFGHLRGIGSDEANQLGAWSYGKLRQSLKTA